MMGGLGNQLFMFAYAKEIQMNLGSDYSIYIIDSFYKRNHIRNLEIMKTVFSNDITVCKNTTISFFDSVTFSLSRLIYRFLFKFLNKDSAFFRKLYPFWAKLGFLFNLDNQYRPLDMELIKKRKTIFLFGYFQNVKYFPNSGPYMRRAFSSIDATQIIEKFESRAGGTVKLTCLSIRVGDDFKKNGWFIEDLEPGYFKRICQIIDAKKMPNILLFSDNCEQAKQYLITETKITEVRSMSPVDQLVLMSKCSLFILSNSTFCWWGFYLSSADPTNAYFPKKWSNLLDYRETGLFLGENTI